MLGFYLTCGLLIAGLIAHCFLLLNPTYAKRGPRLTRRDTRRTAHARDAARYTARISARRAHLNNLFDGT